MTVLFRLIRPAPVLVRIRSRECCTYLFRIMKIIGWIPPEQGIKRYLYLIWSCLAFVFPALYLPLGLALSLILNYKNFTPGEFLSVLQIAFNITGLSVKSFIVFFHIRRLHETRALLDDLDERLQSDGDRGKIHKSVASSNIMVLVFAQLFLSYSVTVFLGEVLNGKPPWQMYNPLFDWRAGVGRFCLQATLEYIIMLLVSSLALIVDTYTLVFVINFRAHIDTLKDHIRNLRTDPFMSDAENYDELVFNIIYHKFILKCCYLMHPVMSHTILIQFLLVGVGLGVTMINVLYFADLSHTISSIVFIASLLFETFPFCYLCDLLVQDCIELPNLLGQSNWFDAERKYKSTLRFFMHNVQQPIIFKAGGVFPISLNSNIKMAKFAFTVMTIVQQMNLADRFK